MSDLARSRVALDSLSSKILLAPECDRRTCGVIPFLFHYGVFGATSIPRSAMPSNALEHEVLARLGMLPNFFGSVSGAPGLADAMWAFAKSAYLDCPLPSLFKERLFVHLSRVCEIRYCLIRHVGFLMGQGRPAGDPDAKPATVEEICALLQRPLPDANTLAVVFARLESCEEAMSIPAPGTQAEYDLFDALTVMVVEPHRSKRAHEAVRNAVGASVFESLTAFIAFARTAQFWTELHPELAIEPDMLSVVEKHEGLARLLLDAPDTKSMNASEALRQALAELEDVRASLRVSTEMLELALQSASQVAWEIGFGTFDIKTVGDPLATFGFDVPANLEKYLAHVPPEDVPAIMDAYSIALTGGPIVDHIEHRLINPITGETVWVHSTGRLVRDNSSVRLVGIARNVTLQKKREEQLSLLVGELQHRTRNLISVVAAIAEKTLTASKTFDDFKASFQDRLGTLARVQGLFFRMREGDRVTFDELLETELSAQSVRVGEDGVVTFDGPKGIRLRSGTVQTLALVLHELLTNAAKYGALKQPNGRLTIRWRLGEVSGEPWLHLDWKESGVKMPPAGTAPQGTGQGRELIEHALRYQFAAQTTFAMEPDGVRFSVSLPVSKLGIRE